MIEYLDRKCGGFVLLYVSVVVIETGIFFWKVFLKCLVKVFNMFLFFIVVIIYFRILEIYGRFFVEMVKNVKLFRCLLR